MAGTNKKRAAYSLQRGPEGNGHRRWVEGVSPVGPVTGDGVRGVASAQPTTKGPARVHLVTKPGLCPLFTAWNLGFSGWDLDHSEKKPPESDHPAARTRGGTSNFLQNLVKFWLTSLLSEA